MREWFKSVASIPGPYSWKVIFQNDRGSIIVSSSEFDMGVTIITGETHDPYSNIGRTIYFHFGASSTWYEDWKKELILNNLNTIINTLVKELEQ